MGIPEHGDKVLKVIESVGAVNHNIPSIDYSDYCV